MQAGGGRFTEQEGEFFKIMTLRSMPQIKAMFSTYRMVSTVLGHQLLSIDMFAHAHA